MKKLGALLGLLSPFGGASSTAAEASDFVPENELEILLVEAAKSPEARPAFTEALRQANLLVATPEAPERSEDRTLEKNETFSILNVQDPDGNVLPAVFTSEIRLAQTFGGGTGYLAMNGKSLFEIIASSGAWINPGSEYSVLYSPSDLASIVGKPERRVLEAETSVLLGSPAEVPDALIDVLRNALSNDKRITEAYLALAMWPDAEDTTWMLEIGSEADPDSLGTTIGAALNGAPLNAKPLDVHVSHPSEMNRTGIRIVPDGTQ